MNSRDLLLLARLKNGDVSAYKELFDIYFMPLCIYSLKFNNSFQQSEDIVQDVFVKFWNEKTYLESIKSIGPYLFKSVKNNTLMHLRKNSKYIFEDIENEVLEVLDEEVDIVALDEVKKKLFIEVEALPTKSKEVFKAIVLDGLKYKEVAKQLDISVNTVKTHYSRALKQLRKSLQLIVFLLLI
jgi:RNA polymerase sigma-70 factor (ECF subfamily)